MADLNFTSVGQVRNISNIDFSACNAYLRGSLEVTLQSQSQESRISSLKVVLFIYKNPGSSPTTQTTVRGSVIVDGSATSYQQYIAELSTDSVIVYTGTHTVSHNTDGTKTVSINLTCYYGSRPQATATVTASLPTIGVSSSFAISPDYGALTIGETQVTYTILHPGDPSWSHKIRARNYTGSTYDITTISPGNTAYTSVLPREVATLFPNAQSETLYFDCIAITSTGTQLGSSTISRSVFLPESLGPTVGTPTLTAVDAAGNPVSYGYIAGVTNIKAVFNVSDTTGSTITSAACTVDGTAYPAAVSGNVATVITGNPVGTSGTVTVRVSAVNARGYSGSNSTQISVRSYAQPYISIFGAARSDQYGNPAQQGTYAKLDYSYVVSKVDDHNKYRITISYKRTVDTVWTNVQDNSNQVPTGSLVTSFLIVPDLEASTTYDFRLTLVDTLTGDNGRAEKIVTLGTDTVIIDLKENGEGIAFGKLSEHNKTVDFGWSVLFTGGISPLYLQSGSTLNSVREPGFYRGTFTDSISGGPASAAGPFGLLVISTGASSCTQILSTEVSGSSSTVSIYVRGIATSGNPSSWYKLSLTSV